MLFFTSDLHFGSDYTIKFDNRPFKNSKQFEKFVIKHWNKIANLNDTIYVIGDFIDCHKIENSCVKKLLLVKKIKAKIVLIIGNNEERIIKYYFNNNFEKFKEYCLSCGFCDVKKFDIIKINETKFYLTHKPKNHRKDMLNLFGHSHKAMGLFKSFGFNIGCDLNNYKLYSEKDINSLLQKKENFWDKDENLSLL